MSGNDAAKQREDDPQQHGVKHATRCLQGKTPMILLASFWLLNLALVAISTAVWRNYLDYHIENERHWGEVMLGQMLTPAYRAAAAMQLAVLVPWPALMCVVAWRGPARRRRSEAAFKAHCLAALIGGILTSGLLMLLMVALLHHTNANLGANQYATEGLEDYFMRVMVMYAAFGVASAILAMVAGVRSAWTLRKVGHDVQQAKERFLGNTLLVVLGCLWLFNVALMIVSIVVWKTFLDQHLRPGSWDDDFGRVASAAYQYTVATQAAVMVLWPGIMCALPWRSRATWRTDAFQAHCNGVLTSGMLASGLLAILVATFIRQMDINDDGEGVLFSKAKGDYYLRVVRTWEAFGYVSVISAVLLGLSAAWLVGQQSADIDEGACGYYAGARAPSQEGPQLPDQLHLQPQPYYGTAASRVAAGSLSSGHMHAPMYVGPHMHMVAQHPPAVVHGTPPPLHAGQVVLLSAGSPQTGIRDVQTQV